MSRKFDKTNNDYLDAGNPTSLNITGDKLTISTWINLDSTNGEQKVLSKWTDAGFQYLLSVNSDDKCLFAVYGSSQGVVVGTAVLGVGDWIPLGGVYDGSQIIVYCGGEPENSASLSGNMSSHTVPFRIGAGSGGSGTEQPFDGNIGHCAIWDIDLTADEMKALSIGINPMQIRPENLVFYAPLNGRNPEVDIIGGVDLTVNGTTVVGEPPIPNSIKAS